MDLNFVHICYKLLFDLGLYIYVSTAEVVSVSVTTLNIKRILPVCYVDSFVCLFRGLTSQSTIFQSCGDRANTS